MIHNRDKLLSHVSDSEDDKKVEAGDDEQDEDFPEGVEAREFILFCH